MVDLAEQDPSVLPGVLKLLSSFVKGNSENVRVSSIYFLPKLMVPQVFSHEPRLSMQLIQLVLS